MSEAGNRSKPPKYRFMQSAEESRASKSEIKIPPHQPPLATAHLVPISKRPPFLQRATQRLTSLSASRIKPSRLPILSPKRGRRHSRESSLILSSPVRRLSHIPEPFKKPLESPVDKPLPSLPVATFVPRSPVHRRSLLDATEQPLRRSITPGNVQEWPALSPLKSPDLEKEMDHDLSAIKPSLGESVLEDMRNLRLDDCENTESRHMRKETRNKIYPVNHTPKPTAYNKDDVEHRQARDTRSPLITPHPASLASDQNSASRKSSTPSLVESDYLQALNIWKTWRNSKATVPETERDDEQSRRPTSSYRNAVSVTSESVEINDTPNVRRSIVARSSAIPRLRGVSGSGSPYASPTYVSPRMVQLKRTKGQVFDILQKQNLRSSTPPEDSPDTGLNCMVEQESPINPAIVQASNSMLETNPETSRRTSSNATVKKNSGHATTHSRVDKEDLRPDFDEDQILRMRNFRFPTDEPDYVDEDTHSELTRATSMSSKAGTIYDRDENGGYRLKPLSQTDPKHGPRVRIEDSADNLLLELNEEQLAKIEAKREAYLRKYPSLTQEALQTKSPAVPELATLRSVSDEATTATQSAEYEQPPSVSQRSEKPNLSAKVKKLAPPVSTNIPSLIHSPTGWPLEVSKIAPFAEVEAMEPIASHRRSASDSDLRTIPSTPRRYDIEDECPGSAYTLRTALNRVSRVNSVRPTDLTRSRTVTRPSSTAVHRSSTPTKQKVSAKSKAKPCKSLPEIVARPFLPAKISSMTNSVPLANLKKETKDVTEPYSDQRTSLRAIKVHSKPTTQANIGHSNAHPLWSDNSTPFSPRYIQSFNTSIRHMNTHADVDSDLPSSPPVVSDIVSLSKPITVKTKVSGIFHKPSKEGLLRRSMSKITMKATKKPPKALSPTLGASPLSSPMSRTDSSAQRQQGSVVKSTPPPSYLRSKTSRLSHNTRSRNDYDPPSQPTTTISQPVNEGVALPDLITSALEPIELRDATQLAFTLLDKARDSFEAGSPGMKRYAYVELAKALASTVSAARNVEKAAEEAKQAAVRAEMEAVRTKKAVVHVCECVEQLIGCEGNAGIA